MATTVPVSTKAVVFEKSSEKKSSVYHDARIVQRPLPTLKGNQVVLRMGAVGLNHRDVWIRKDLYPGIALGVVAGTDGAGTVIASSRHNDELLNQRVFMTPHRGWNSDPEAPEFRFGILGGVKYPEIGTFAEYVVVDRDEVIPTPAHLDDVHAAAWPLAGVTAWRVIKTKAQVEKGHNVLVTGIGGGVALVILQLVVGLGANVYVTSGSQEKIDKAIALGAKAGFNYKKSTWPSDLAKVLQAQNASLDVVIDSAGGDIIGQTSKLLNQGCRVVCYGMTASPKITFTMREVLKNIDLKGSTAGSRRELQEATEFIARHKIVPVVSHVIDGLERCEEGFEAMEKGAQLGKIVIRIRPEGSQGKL